MKTMVEDLLVFNQFATNAVSVNKDLYNVNEVVEDAIISWQVAQKEEMEIKLFKLPSPIEVMIDPIRFQQIMTNLLNNANHAVGSNGEILVTLIEDETQIFIDVSDTGEGIPDEEQSFIFERFFRGERKKHKIRGLGLGLALSKIVAQALGGNLILLKSSREGTTFRIMLPKVNEKKSSL